MTDTYDAVIVGGGFKGMMTAYGLTKQGMKVCIIEKGKQLGGFMSPMNWKGVDVDKGPQYLDGIGEQHKSILDDIMGDFEPLASLDFSYASYWNQQYTDGFALPDYRSLPLTDKATVLYESLNQQDADVEASNIAQLYSADQQTSFAYIDAWCKKFLRRKAEELSPLNRGITTFFGRKLLLDNELSLQLKEHPVLDDVLAANKKSLSHGTYNLYPEGRNLGYFREAFEHKLSDMGVSVHTETEINSVSPGNNSVAITAGNTSMAAKTLYCTATLEVSEQLLTGNDSMSSYIAPVAQVFFLLESSVTPELPFYVMNYSAASVSRVTNFTAYANRSNDGRAILCVEVPTEIGSDLWQDPEQHVAVMMREIADMGINTSAITAHQAFKIPGTYRATLSGYEAALQTFMDDISNRYNGNIVLPTPHLLTRASIMHDLSALNILQ